MAASDFPPVVGVGGGGSGRFAGVYRRSLEQPEEFWAQLQQIGYARTTTE